MTCRYRTVLTGVLVVYFPLVVISQGSGPEATQNFQFFMDSTKDCNGPVFNIFDRQAEIKGHSSGDVQQSPLSCTIRLQTENNFDKTRFTINVRSMKIQDKDVNFVIYDGEPGQLTLDAFDYYSTNPRQQYITTSTKVSFVLTRRDNRNTKYDIWVVAKPFAAGLDPGYENGDGSDYGYFNRMVPNMVIYIIVGVLFFVVITIIVIVAVVCHRKHKGLNKKPDQYKISYIATNANASRGAASEASTKTWITTSRNSLRRDRKNHHNYDDDSVFDGSVDTLPNKKQYKPDRSYENTNYRDRNQRQERPSSYRNNSFVQADDDHPQDVYIQREIKPRVKSTRAYEPEEEDDVESVGVGPDEEDEEVSEGEEEQETEEEQSEEEEEGEDDSGAEDVDFGDVHQPPPQHVPDHPPPRLGHQAVSGVPQPTPRHPPTTDQPRSLPADPRQMPVGGPYGPRFVVYPGQPHPQFMPLPAGPSQFQPISGPAISMPPPQYPGKSQQPQRPYQVKPSDPPIYSYLVQRGYNPEDGRESPVSVSTNASGRSDTRLIQPEDSDMSAYNLDSGVEYMRR